MKTNTQFLLNNIHGNLSYSEKFHNATKNKKLVIPKSEDIGKFPESWIKIHFKTYPRFKAFKLQQSSNVSFLSNIINKRVSMRKFTGKAISYEIFCSLLFNSGGINRSRTNIDNSKRTYPSAGARYSLELYSIVMNVKGLQKGLYHYNVKENILESILEENLWNTVYESFGREIFLENAAVIFIISGVLKRTSIKYRDRGYRYMLIESGHLAQNLCLLATEFELGVCTLGGFIDDKLIKLLDLSLQNEYPIYSIAIGQK